MSGLLASLLMAVGLMKVYVEDVFSAYTYTGNGSTQTITTGIPADLTWLKGRAGGPNSGADAHWLFDTARGNNHYLSSNSTGAQDYAGASSQFSFTSTGFSVGNTGVNGINNSGETIVAWNFAKQAKFFDVVTYSGNGSSTNTIAHNLGQTPGMIFVKKTAPSTAAWAVYHRSPGTGYVAFLNTTDPFANYTAYFPNDPTSTNFTVGSDSWVNSSGSDYIAYVFAHDTGTDGLIQCGSFTTDGSSNATVTLGWEPQFLMVKNSGATGSWQMFDTARGLAVQGTRSQLLADSSGAEVSTGSSANSVDLTSTGFKINNLFGASATLVYMAIRAPMKVPTAGTQVFNAIARTGNSGTYNVTGVGFAPDVVITGNRSNAAYRKTVISRLRGAGKWLNTSGTDSEGSTASEALQEFSMDGHRYVNDGSGQVNYSGYTYLDWCFKRAPGFMQEVCYTGTGSAKTEAHGLGVAPELWISKSRSATNRWVIGCSYLPTPASDFLELSTSTKGNDTTTWNNTVPTASVFSVGTGTDANSSGVTYDMLLFATCPGVSKVGSYTGTGTTLQINCGFAAGARFALIKRTDSTGDWYVWDSVRGIVSGNDPYLLLNSTAAEVTGTDYIDPLNAGFEISSTAPAAINASGGTFIFLAIA